MRRRVEQNKVWVWRLQLRPPQKCGLDWVRGSVPTPAGLIEIEWREFQRNPPG
jgi:hypothetical protein